MARKIEDRFKHHVCGSDQLIAMMKIHGAALGFAEIIQNLSPESREQSIALTKLEEVVFWANAAIARGVEDAS